jgi:UDP-GlcNAc:undecaprenyl-phosphate GlcNAc-1-phosphate transferase
MVLVSTGYLVCFVASVGFSLVFTWWLKKLATSRGWAKAPTLDRHVHTDAVPRLGGVAIYLSFVSIVCLAFLVPSWIGIPPVLPLITTLGILGPALIVFLLGLYDDVIPIGPYRKFGVQVGAAVLLYLNGFGIHQLDLLSVGHTLISAVSLPLTVLWVLLITNAFNLIDGLDGLAAGSALFSTIVVLAVSLIIPNPMVTFLTIALAGAILGFLRFNFHPASIFLGDSGSLFIGFMLSALALAGSQKAPTMVAVAIPVVSFGFPILDATLAVVRRFIGGKPLFIGDKEHIHHRLLKRGLSQREAVVVLYLATAGFALLSLFLIHNAGMIGLVLLVMGAGIWLGVQRLHYPEFAELSGLVRRTKKQMQIFTNNIEIRRAAESLNSCSEFAAICRILQSTLQPLGFAGFQLNNPSMNDIGEQFLAPLQNTTGDGFRFCWRELGSPEAPWELRFELATSSGYRVGYFSLLRTWIKEPLMLDVDLFSWEFRTSLSGAIHRTLNRIQISEKRESRAQSVSRVTIGSALSAD